MGGSPASAKQSAKAGTSAALTFVTSHTRALRNLGCGGEYMGPVATAHAPHTPQAQLQSSTPAATSSLYG